MNQELIDLNMIYDIAFIQNIKTYVTAVDPLINYDLCNSLSFGKSIDCENGLIKVLLENSTAEYIEVEWMNWRTFSLIK